MNFDCFVINNVKSDIIENYLCNVPGYSFKRICDDPITLENTVGTMYNHAAGSIKVSFLLHESDVNSICLQFIVENGDSCLDESLTCLLCENLGAIYNP